MTIPQNFKDFQLIPHKKLFLSLLNVRKELLKKAVRELADLIAVEGVLQNLVVYKEVHGRGKRKTESFGVVAGGLRYLAACLLIDEGRLTPNFLMPCIVTSPERAVSISLSENSGRQELHPADQFEAFRDLVKQGRAIDDVAAAFSVTPLVVRQRLRLANVHPDFLSLYRSKDANLEQLMALAVTDDRERQQAAWRGLAENQRTPSALRRLLTESEIALSRPLATFVGLATYSAAGGEVRMDLFALTPEEGTLLLDPALVERLARQKLTAEADARRLGAGAWIEISTAPNFAAIANYRHAGVMRRALTLEEEERLSVIARELETLEDRQSELEDGQDEDGGDFDENDHPNEDEGTAAELVGGEVSLARSPIEADELVKIQARIKELEHEEREISDELVVVKPEWAPFAGTLLCVDDKGALRVFEGLLKPEDADRIVEEKPAASRAATDAKKKGTAGAMFLRLSAHRTQALQATLMDDQRVALAALCERLVKATLLPDAENLKTALNIQVSIVPLEKFADDVRQATAFSKLQSRKMEWLERIPKDPGDLFGWLLQQPEAAVAELLALCTALSVNAVEDQPGTHRAEALAKAARLDMANWWIPTADGYLSKIKKDDILAIVKTAVSDQEAARIEGLKKPEMARAAEKLLETVRWVPDYYRETQTAAAPNS